MCIRDRPFTVYGIVASAENMASGTAFRPGDVLSTMNGKTTVSYTHLRAHETVLDIVCRLLLEKKKRNTKGEGSALGKYSRQYTKA